MKLMLLVISLFVLSSPNSQAQLFSYEYDTSPSFLGAPKIEFGYGLFACVIGTEVETYVSYPNSEYNNFEIITNTEDPNLRKNEIKIVVSAFSKKRIKRDLFNPFDPPKINPKFFDHPGCKNQILMGYELAGAIRMNKSFIVEDSFKAQVIDILKNVNSLEEFYDLEFPKNIKITGQSLEFSVSDNRIKINDIFYSNTRDGFLNASRELLKDLDAIYTVDYVRTLPLKKQFVVSLRLIKY